MESKNRRINLLKWASSKSNRVKSLWKTVNKLSDELSLYPELQDLTLNTACSQLGHLMDRMEFLDKKINSEKFVNEGLIEDADQKIKR